MAEPFFGSGPQLWPAIPALGFGFAPAPFPPGTRPAGPMTPGAHGAMSLAGGMPLAGGMTTGVPAQGPLASESFAGGNWAGSPNPGFLGNPATSFNAGLSAAIMPGPVGGVPVFSGSEIAIGVTAPALLSAVAMRRGQPLGPTNDQEIEDFIYDALDLLPGASDVEVRCEGGRAIVTGTVPHKRLKRDVGEIAWAIPALNDVQNNITIAARRRGRSQARESEQTSSGGKKS